MHLILLIIGIVFIPQAYGLKCNECKTGSDVCGEGEESQCSAEFTRCGILRRNTYEGNTKIMDYVLGTCFKADDCKDGSFDAGIKKYMFTSKCCDTDLCNTEQPPPASLKPNPNGIKCYRCDGKSDCTGTLNCDGEETFCASVTEKNTTVKGCATRSFCVNPPTVISSAIKGLKCCEGNYCNVGSSTRASLLLLAAMLISLLFLSN